MLQLLTICVERRWAALGATLLVAAWGVYAWGETPIEAFPDVTNAQVSIIAQASGLAPEEVERQVTVPIERTLAGLPGTLSLRSESLFGLSLLTVTFDDGVDSFKARVQVAQRVASADLPDGVDAELAPDATPLGEVFQYRLVSDRHDLTTLRSWQDWTVARALRQVPGVADVVGFGGFVEELHVEVDPMRLQAAGLAMSDLVTAIGESNLNVGGGLATIGDQAYAVRGVGALRDADDLRSVPVDGGDVRVLVGDLAQTIQSHTPRMGSAGFGDKLDTVEGFVLLRRGENPSRVLDGVHARVETLKKVLPEGMRIEVFYDRSALVGHTLETVNHNLIEGFLFIAGTVWLFLRSWRGSLVVASVIPLALLGAFSGLHGLGMSANLISMGAIDFGILVDGAVVLIEHVLHEGGHHPPSDAAGVRRIVAQAGAAVARPTMFAMAIIIAALLPVFTLERVEGRIFRPLAVTYALALVAALALTLVTVPALAAVVFRPQDLAVTEPRWIAALRTFYGRRLDGLLAWPSLTFAAGAGLVLVGLGFGSQLGTEFLPELDEGDAVLFVEMPGSISLVKGQEILLEVRRRILKFPEVLAVMSEQGRPEDGTDNEGPSMSETFVRFKPPETWPRSITKAELIDEMRESLSDIPGVVFNFSQPIKDNVEEAVSGVRGKVVLKVFGDDLGGMRGTLLQARDVVSGIDGVIEADLYRNAVAPQLQVRFDRPALARYGLTIREAGLSLEAAMAGALATTMWKGERQIPVRVRLPPDLRSEPDAVAAIPLRSHGGHVVPMGAIADLSFETGPASILREDNRRVMALKFNVSGRDVGSVVDDAIAAVADQVHPPAGSELVWSGEFENQQRVMSRMKVVVPISLLVVCSLLVASLGSLRSALLVLGVAPFSMVGGVVGLWLMGVTLSVSALIGFIALLGQVSLAGLLMLTAIERTGANSEAPRVAARRGATESFRAILMTSALAGLGLLPMAVSTGVGAETQRPFAVVIVFGMVTTLPVVLGVLPVWWSRLPGAPVGAPKEAS